MIQGKSLIDSAHGLISRRMFVEQEIYEAELERIFARSWLFLAHETMIPNPGDFFSTYMGEDPVIVIRDSGGKINAFINSCRHRGMKVCRADEGNAASFTCAYHGWTYGNDGKLIGVPNFQDAYFEQLDMEQWGLVPVAQVDSYKGLIFGNFDASAPALIPYLGDVTFYLDTFLDRRAGGTEVVGGVHKWVMPCNWKFAADNFSGDNYHVGVSHLSAILTGALGGGDPEAARLGPDDGITATAGNGHSLAVLSKPLRETEIPPLRGYAAEITPEMQRRLGDVRANHMAPIVGTVFPNFSVLPILWTMRVWHPRGPNKTETWSWCLVDKDAPQEVKDTMRLTYMRTFSAGGTLEVDDMENWQMCTQTSAGVMTRRYPFNYAMGMGHEKVSEEYPGLAGARITEVTQRGFYQRWAEMIDANSWADLEQ